MISIPTCTYYDPHDLIMSNWIIDTVFDRCNTLLSSLKATNNGFLNLNTVTTKFETNAAIKATYKYLSGSFAKG